jgi:hypothetical protein
MTDKSNKPLGTFAKLMSSSPIKEEEKQNSGKPENLKTGKPENLKAIKYCTQLHKDTIIRLKQYALINEIKDYKVVEDAITEYLEKRQSGKPENLKT